MAERYGLGSCSCLGLEGLDLRAQCKCNGRYFHRTGWSMVVTVESSKLLCVAL
jgi:hypothetical protein